MEISERAKLTYARPLIGFILIRMDIGHINCMEKQIKTQEFRVPFETASH